MFFWLQVWVTKASYHCVHHQERVRLTLCNSGLRGVLKGKKLQLPDAWSSFGITKLLCLCFCCLPPAVWELLHCFMTTYMQSASKTLSALPLSAKTEKNIHLLQIIKIRNQSPASICTMWHLVWGYRAPRSLVSSFCCGQGVLVPCGHRVRK